MITENEIPNWKKKTESDVSKAIKKSNHKHKYILSLVKTANENHKYQMVKYCSICGKVYDWWVCLVERNEDKYYVSLTDEQILEKYKDLPILEMDIDYNTKFIPIEKHRYKNE